MEETFTCELCKKLIYSKFSGQPRKYEYYSWDVETKTSPKKVMILCKICDDEMDADQVRLKKLYGPPPRDDSE